MSFLSGGLDYLPEGLLQEFTASVWNLGDIFNINLDAIKNIDVNSAKDLLDSTDGAIQNFLDTNVGGLLDSMTQ
jgi:hypothetical protein